MGTLLFFFIIVQLSHCYKDSLSIAKSDRITSSLKNLFSVVSKCLIFILKSLLMLFIYSFFSFEKVIGHFLLDFIINFYISVENDIRILIGIELNLCITFSSIYILTVLVISVHEHRISFYVFMYFSIYFINVLCLVFSYQTFIFLTKSFLTTFKPPLNTMIN